MLSYGNRSGWLGNAARCLEETVQPFLLAPMAAPRNSLEEWRAILREREEGLGKPLAPIQSLLRCYPATLARCLGEPLSQFSNLDDINSSGGGNAAPAVYTTEMSLSDLLGTFRNVIEYIIQRMAI